jgi:hypothetical protein
MAETTPILIVAKSPAPECAATNFVYLNAADATRFAAGQHREQLPAANLAEGQPCALRNYLRVRDFVFSFLSHDEVPKGQIGLNSDQRLRCGFALKDPASCVVYEPQTDSIYIIRAVVRVGYRAKQKEGETHVVGELDKFLRQSLSKQFVSAGQYVVLNYRGVCLKFGVISFETTNAEGIIQLHEGKQPDVMCKEAKLGIISPATTFDLRAAPPLRLSGGLGGTLDLVRPDLNPEAMGIGGLDKERASATAQRAVVRRHLPARLRHAPLSSGDHGKAGR